MEDHCELQLTQWLQNTEIRYIYSFKDKFSLFKCIHGSGLFPCTCMSLSLVASKIQRSLYWRLHPKKRMNKTLGLFKMHPDLSQIFEMNPNMTLFALEKIAYALADEKKHDDSNSEN